MPGEDLGRYVTRVLKQRGMTVRDVEESSGGGISNGYVSDIMSGRQVNPSADKLLALAGGLGVDVHELLDAALNEKSKRAPGPEAERIDPVALLELMKKVVGSPALVELLHEASVLEPKEQRLVLETVRQFSRLSQRRARRKRSG
jgi:transcriptional regulator with XRE-family HTH domain